MQTWRDYWPQNIGMRWSKKHRANLEKLRKVCGEKSTRIHSCSQSAEQLGKRSGSVLTSARMTLTTVTSTLCVTVIPVETYKILETGYREKPKYNPNEQIHQWVEHTDSEALCGGQGHPTPSFLNQAGHRISAIVHINALVPTGDKEYRNWNTTWTCPLCLFLLRDPVELTTCWSACAEFCCQWLRISQSVSCPCYYSAHLSILTSYGHLPLQSWQSMAPWRSL